jgi:glutamyl-tRNA synthetase/glutamyl-Q tRNA(Asp) synthetase
VYACDCTRSDLSEGPATTGERRYPGVCREKGLPQAEGFGLRVHLEHSVERFDDLCRGRQSQCPADQCGDLLIRDRDGNWTYQFAVAVDDFAQDVTLVIRGNDLLPSTGRQIQLARLLGRHSPPRFLHHPLVMKSPTQKLSKSDGDTSVRSLREKGWSAERLIGQAALIGGLTDRFEPIPARDVPALASLVSMNRSR